MKYLVLYDSAKLSFAFLFALALLSSDGQTTILEQIEGKSPHFFATLFDHDLYDLNHTNRYDADRTCGLELQENADESFERLQKRKLKRLQETLIADISHYMRQINAVDLTAITNRALHAAISGAKTSGMFMTLANSAAQSVVKGGLVVGSSVALLELAVDYFTDASHNQELRKAQMLIDHLGQALAHEPVIPAEKLYLMSRQKLSSEQQRAIETVLLNARAEQHHFSSGPEPLEFVREMLSFPTSVLVLPAGFDWRNADAKTYKSQRDEFLRAIFPSLYGSEEDAKTRNHDERRLDSPFYQIDTRKELKGIMSRLCDYAWNARDGRDDAVKTRGFLFYGHPGAGKTVAANLFASTMQLPSYELNIIKASDYDKGNLYGKQASALSKGKRGSLPQALMSTNRNGQTAQNVIVVINDVDRGFRTDDGQGIDLEGLMNFLLDLFDVNKKWISAHYYSLKRLNFSNVIIIATINTDIRHDNNFAALKSRCQFVHFREPPREQLRKIIDESLTDDDLCLSFYGDDAEHFDDIRRDIADFIIGNFCTSDNRELGRRAFELKNCACDEWEDVARSQGWTCTRDEQ